MRGATPTYTAIEALMFVIDPLFFNGLVPCVVSVDCRLYVCIFMLYVCIQMRATSVAEGGHTHWRVSRSARAEPSCMLVKTHIHTYTCGCYTDVCRVAHVWSPSVCWERLTYIHTHVFYTCPAGSLQARASRLGSARGVSLLSVVCGHGAASCSSIS